MSRSPSKVHDVAIVGFGPVGQMLALLLGRAGHDVIALERWPGSYDLPRAVHFDHEIGRVFQAVEWGGGACDHRPGARQLRVAQRGR